MYLSMDQLPREVECSILPALVGRVATPNFQFQVMRDLYQTELWASNNTLLNLEASNTTFFDFLFVSFFTRSILPNLIASRLLRDCLGIASLPTTPSRSTSARRISPLHSPYLFGSVQNSPLQPKLSMWCRPLLEQLVFACAWCPATSFG